jgi:hypothetical protein
MAHGAHHQVADGSSRMAISATMPMPRPRRT